jgi:hypothetical protein
MEMIDSGATLPFTDGKLPEDLNGWQELPHSRRHDPEHQKLLRDTVLEGVKLGHWRKVPMGEESPFLVRMFLLIKVKPDGSTKIRPCIDFRALNAKLSVPKVRFEHVTLLKEMQSIVNAFFVSLDLKEAFHHDLAMKPEFRRFMRFGTPTGPDGETEVFEVISMPFGESAAPFRLTKLMRPALRHWRMGGYKCLLYLDDLLLWNACRETLMEQVRMVLRDGESMGIG